MQVISTEANWTMVLKPRNGWFDVNLKELWHYRDLILLFVWRDFVAQYKQTILGPLWFLFQPLLSTTIFTVVFGRIAGIPTDGIPPFLFYLSGLVCWTYFSTCMISTSNTFVSNANIFGKVYFPRLVVPISIVLSSIFTFLIQFVLFICFFIYFFWAGSDLKPNIWIMASPLLLLQMALLGLGMGILISSLTTKYRDLSLLTNFGVQLWMYATPVIYPLSQIPEKYRSLYLLNPMTSIIESFRYAFLGVGTVQPKYLAISWLMTIIILLGGISLFSKVEKTFMDTV